MPFGFGREIAVLEGKFQIYEDLSKEMLDKLERAVEKIGEGNQSVALILAKHEEKIEQGIRADELILKMIDEMRDSNGKQNELIVRRIESVESKLGEVSKFRWVAAGVGAVIVFLIGSAEFFGRVLTLGTDDATMGGSIERIK